MTPSWLVQCVVDGSFTPKESLKLTFYLEPHQRSRLPELPPGANRLSAPRALKAARIAAHVQRSLNLTQPLPADSIVLYCADKPLPPQMSLLTARQYVWRQGGDMLITYREA